jgi:hypothetical protein
MRYLWFVAYLLRKGADIIVVETTAVTRVIKTPISSFSTIPTRNYVEHRLVGSTREFVPKLIKTPICNFGGAYR